MVEEQYAGASSAIVTSGRGLLSNKRLDSLIRRALNLSYDVFTESVSISEIQQLCDTVTNVLRQQPALVEVRPPVIVCGDIHGQYVDLKKIFATIGYPPRRRYIFLGDIVDRGQQNIETAVILLCFKARYPDEFFLLRGNHECSKINKIYGFLGEIERRYGARDSREIWMLFNNAFAWFPYTALINKRILCMHGGLSPGLDSLQRLRELRRPMLDPPRPSLEIDILWSDPEPGLRGVRPSPRKAGVLFGEDVVHNVCRQLGLDLIVRAHKCIPSGAEYFADNKMLTIFSAPRYSRNNEAATLTIDENLIRSFDIFQ